MSLLAVAAIPLSIPAVDASVAFKVLKDFSSAAGQPEGALLEIPDGATPVFYGTAVDDGGFGTVFRIAPTGDGGFTSTILHAFNGLDGAMPMSTLVQGVGGYLYGTTTDGGQFGGGTIFKVSKDGAFFSSLYSFGGSDDGVGPNSLLLGADGNFYGTTSGGADAYGTIFRISPAGTGFATLHTFLGTDGSHPYGALIEVGGVLYGTTSAGGTGNSGTIFSFSLEGSTFGTVHAFSSTTDGSYPSASLIKGTSGDLYGTTPFGGLSGNGTVFQVATDGTFAVLHSFAYSDGATSYGSLIESKGYFYGTTAQGGTSGFGTVFRISASGLEFDVVHSFIGASHGSDPDAALIQGSDGALYGTASGYGPCGAGTVFRLTLDDSGLEDSFQVIETFSSGVQPTGGVVRGSDGRLYGTTTWGGQDCTTGVVFGMNVDGSAYTRLHTFTGTDGTQAKGQLVQAPDGTLYGATGQGGGDPLCGNVFKISPGGSGFLSLYSFLGPDGCHPTGLVRTSNGELFGTTTGGGEHNLGTVFRLYKLGENWSLETLRSFNTSDGVAPRGLTLSADGNLYGTTAAGGDSGYGSIFRISTGGSFLTLRSLTSADGNYPLSALTEGEGGWFYGSTQLGGAFSQGTLFKIDKDGNGFAILHSFNNDDGAEPYAALVRDAAGNLYGTTSAGGDFGSGTVFKLAADETTFTTLHAFSGGSDDGSQPTATLFVADGSLYGTTQYGGWNDNGTVFRIQLGTSAVSVSVSAGGKPTTFCEGGSVDLTAIPAGGTGEYPAYQWYRDLVLVGGATSSTFAATESGAYSATATDSDGNTSPKSEGVVVTVNPLPEATITPGGSTALCPGADVTLTASGGVGSSWLWSTGETASSISVETPDDYTVVVTDANGCQATSDPVTVTSVAPPAATVSGGGLICPRGSSTIQAALTGTAPWNVTWSDGVTQTNIPSGPATRTVSPRTTTTYSVTSVSDANCTGSGSGTATVTTATPPKAVLKGSTTICPGGSATLTVELTGTPPWSITWSDQQIDSNILESPFQRTVTEPAVYSITSVSDAGCGAGTARGSARIKISRRCPAP